MNRDPRRATPIDANDLPTSYLGRLSCLSWSGLPRGVLSLFVLSLGLWGVLHGHSALLCMVSGVLAMFALPSALVMVLAICMVTTLCPFLPAGGLRRATADH